MPTTRQYRRLVNRIFAAKGGAISRGFASTGFGWRNLLAEPPRTGGSWQMAKAKRSRVPPEQGSLFELPDETSPFHIAPHEPGFEALVNENGFAFWWASDLGRFLGYDDLRSFRNAVQKAMTVCMQVGMPLTDNFVPVKREVCGKEQEDYKLSRFACYLAAMNGDVKKRGVAQAQAYFVTYARACEVIIAESNDVHRVGIRGDISELEKGLARTASEVGVKQFGLFQNAGYRGLYNMSMSSLRSLKNLPGGRSPLDFMGQRELAANLFRIEETEERLRVLAVRGQSAAEATAEDVGREVRSIMTKDGGRPPEELPPEEDIRTVRNGIKRAGRDFKKLDQSTAPKVLPKQRKP